MGDDLVKRLKNPRPMSMFLTRADQASDWTELLKVAANRIEELEGKLKTAEEIGRAFEEDAGQLREKLARAVGALGDIYDGEPEWPDEPEKELEWCRNRAKRTLAELKGQGDE